MGNKKHYNFPPGYSMKNANLGVYDKIFESDFVIIGVKNG